MKKNKKFQSNKLIRESSSLWHLNANKSNIKSMMKVADNRRQTKPVSNKSDFKGFILGFSAFMHFLEELLLYHV